MAARSASGSRLAIHFFAGAAAQTTVPNSRPCTSAMSVERNCAANVACFFSSEPTKPLCPSSASAGAVASGGLDSFT
jgi:hypothetical protein